MNTNIESSPIGKSAKGGEVINQKGGLAREAVGFLVILCLVVGVTMILSSCVPPAKQETTTPAVEEATAPEGTGEEAVTSVGGFVADTQHYENLEYAISFDYPAAWKTYSKQDALSVKAIAADNMIIGVTKPGSNYNIRMAVTVETGGPDSFSDEEYRNYAQMLDQASPSGMAKFQKISDEIITIGGVRALEYVFQYDPQLGTGLDQIRQISVVWKGKAFTLSCGAPVGEFDAVNKDVFDLIVRSFRFD